MADAQQCLALAREAESRGDIDAAVPLYYQAKQPEQAARLLVAHARFAEAAQVFMRIAAIAPERVARDDRERRRAYRNAAVCLARGGDVAASVDLLLRLGDAQKAADVLERTGDAAGAARLRTGGKLAADAALSKLGPKPPQHSEAGSRLEKEGRLELAFETYREARMPADAGRVAHKLKRFAAAAELFENAAQFYEAAVCWADAGDKARCLSLLVQVPREHKRYRAACSRAIAIASELGRFNMEIDQFLARFTATSPEGAAELEAFARAGMLYEAHGFPESAQGVYRKLLAVEPQHAVAARLRRLDAAQQGSAVAYEAILQEEARFMHGAAGPRKNLDAPENALARDILPSLSDLPPPPGMPALRARPHASAPLADTPAPRAPRAESPSPEQPPLRPDALQPGQLVAQRYRVEAKIGEGGMAAIYRALDTELDEDVAIKVFTLPSEQLELVARFKQELAIARKLTHPNIVRVHDLGVDRGCRFMTMELLSGCDLSQLILRGRPSLARAVDLLGQACAGLEVAHQRNVIHRDIKPENFFVTDDGTLKVMDFGIAKSSRAGNKTHAGVIAGTPAYMSPEQIAGFSQVTALTDLYALGIVAYELCTGSVPFAHEELMPLLMMHVNDTPEPPRARNPEIPATLERLILRLLAKDPAARVQSCGELRAELQRVASTLTQR
jgi:eukaryotic-like serine/threonine-protein kinase